MTHGTIHTVWRVVCTKCGLVYQTSSEYTRTPKIDAAVELDAHNSEECTRRGTARLVSFTFAKERMIAKRRQPIPAPGEPPRPPITTVACDSCGTQRAPGELKVWGSGLLICYGGCTYATNVTSGK